MRVKGKIIRKSMKTDLRTLDVGMVTK